MFWVELTEPKHFTRTEAIDLLKILENSQYDDEEIEPYDFDTMSNEDLEEELCLSGVIHDCYMLGVIDDA